MNSAAFALVQTGQIGLRENHLAEQMMDEPRTTAARVGTPALMPRLAPMLAVVASILRSGAARWSGRNRAIGGTLITIAGERHVDEQAQALADLPELMREVEDAATALGIALGVHAHDHLAVEATQQFFELVARRQRRRCRSDPCGNWCRAPDRFLRGSVDRRTRRNRATCQPCSGPDRPVRRHAVSDARLADGRELRSEGFESRPCADRARFPPEWSPTRRSTDARDDACATAPAGFPGIAVDFHIRLRG